MEEKNERKEKSEILFKKAMDCYSKQDYEEALKYFKASKNYYPNDRADLFIRVCENNIPQNNTKQNTYQKSYSSSFSSNYNKSFSNNNTNSNSYSRQTSSNTDNSSNNQDNNKNDSDDLKCKELLKKKDYYDLLNIKKGATPEEIKKAYKKQAIKFHPDKNHSKMAEECFKKISEAYQCLSDPEKKSFYDKYGNEQEFKEQYFQRNHRHYQEEMDPFEAFNIFFGSGFFPAGRYHFRTGDDFPRSENIQNRSKLLQFFPLIFLFLIYILPNLAFLFESKPLYQFTRDESYNHKRKTPRNNVEFYVGDKFIKKYPKMKDFQSLEPTIEREYLEYLYDDCSNIINYKNRLMYYMQMSYTASQRNQYKRKIDQLNFNSCNKYNSLYNRIK